MPLYEYKCPHCNNKFEKNQPINKRRSAKCPECNHKAYLSTFKINGNIKG